MRVDQVFAVFREGIQRHECGGIFTTPAAATAAAYDLIYGEPDDYHKYTVVEFILDERSPQIKGEGAQSYGDGELVERTPVFTLTRSKHVITTRRGK